MSKTFHLCGFILSRRNKKDYAQIISFYSQEIGKVEILVRGARKINSKLAPLLAEPFALLKLVVAQGRFLHLIGGEKKQSWPKILNEGEKLRALDALFQQINKLIKPQPDEKVFSLLYKFLKTVNKLEKEKFLIIINAFLIKLLSFLGYRPEIRKCLICGFLPREQELFFDFNKGGIVCLKHNFLKKSLPTEKREKDFIKITQRDWRVLQKLLYQDFNSLLKQSFSLRELKRAEKVIKKFFVWHLE